MEKSRVIKVGDLATASIDFDGNVLIEQENSNEMTKISKEKFLDEYVSYECLPQGVMQWLFSAIEQHMPISYALAPIEMDLELTNYDYSKLNPYVRLWLASPENQIDFTQAMILGPRLMVDDSMDNPKFEQLSLF